MCVYVFVCVLCDQRPARLLCVALLSDVRGTKCWQTSSRPDHTAAAEALRLVGGASVEVRCIRIVRIPGLLNAKKASFQTPKNSQRLGVLPTHQHATVRQRSRGPEDQRTRGPEDQRTRGSTRGSGAEDQRTSGSKNHLTTRGPEGQRTRGRGQRTKKNREPEPASGENQRTREPENMTKGPDQNIKGSRTPEDTS